MLTEVAAPARTFGTFSGQLGELIDQYDWAGTCLGPVSRWPAVVHATVELVLRSALPCVTLWGDEGVMIYNQGYADIAAERHPALLGMPVRDGWPEAAAFNDHVMKVGMAGGTLSYRDQEMPLSRGGRIEPAFLNLDYSPIVDQNGSVLGVIAWVIETTDKVAAQRYRDGERDRLQAMFEQAPGFMLQLAGPDHVFQLANAASMALVSGRPLVGKPVREALPETLPQGVIGLLDRVYRSGTAHAAQARELWLAEPCGNRRQVFVDFVCQPLRGADGEVFGIFVQGSDVTERVRAERAERAGEAKFRTFAQAMPHQVWTTDPDGHADWFNERAVDYSGLAPARLAGIGWTAMVHPEDLRSLTTRWATAVAGGGAFEAELRLRARDGAYRWHLSRAVPVREAGGKVLYWIGTNTDIEQQKQSARSLAQLNAGLEQAVAQRTAERDRMWRLSKDIMMVAGFDGIVQAVSPAFGALLGWSEADIVGRNHLELVHPEDRGAVVAQMALLGRGQSIHKVESRLRRKDGSWCLLSWNAAPDAGLIHAIGRDITADREQAEQIRRTELALQQAQKMETIGKLTGGVAHDFNNLLQIISGNLQLMEMDGDGPSLQRWIANARSAVEKGAKLASYLLAFGRRQPLEPRVVKLSRVVIGMEDMLRRSLGEEIEVELVISGGLWNTAIDVAQLENALLNLAINARDAMSAGGMAAGRLTIEANNAVLDDLYCRSHAEVTPGQYVMLAVTDTGTGMAPEVLAKAFEPFFSTKEEGKGSGLGLSMVYGFVKQSGGHVKIYSEAGQGTTVKIYLPRTLATEEAVGALEPQQAVGGSETILVAEDDEAVRATVVEMLTALGYRVLKAADAASALAVVESGVPIDVLFTDVVMPGTLRSPELARMARERLPNLAVLFTSGYTENAIVHGGRLDPGVELLGKPYTRESLARRIRQVIAAGRGRAQPAAAAPVPPPGAAANTERLRIVLVEDEDDIREATAALLRHLGHEVAEAADAERALALISGSSDLLITDVMLPGMSGDLLAAQARALAPAIRIVFATGTGEVNNWPDAVVLRKPYNLQSLMEVLAPAAA
ncbi:PAS domain-containing protein [Herbaspirillum sp. SJZ107]|uniref:PAS domain-containing protein n=1 Tax=Herbaspirillum sp. SJZ107 TaxID=2572881 RepID=UPI001150DB68|nr:PAS domain-containing protein [Herbaspirillum sp. SJZ107]